MGYVNFLEGSTHECGYSNIRSVIASPDFLFADIEAKTEGLLFPWGLETTSFQLGVLGENMKNHPTEAAVPRKQGFRCWLCGESCFVPLSKNVMPILQRTSGSPVMELLGCLVMR